MENSPQWKKNWKLIRFVFMPMMAICFILGVIYLSTKGLYLSTLIAGAIGIIIGGGGFLYYLLLPEYTPSQNSERPRTESVQL